MNILNYANERTNKNISFFYYFIVLVVLQNNGNVMK